MPSSLDFADEHAVANARGHRIGIALDGSAVSAKALKAGVRLFDPSRGDRLYLLHISDETKLAWLPAHLTPDHLRHQFDVLAQELNVDCVWYNKEKGPGQSTCEALTELSEQLHIDVLVVGSFGRKGEKLDMLGTVSDGTLRSSNASVFIVKSTAFELGQCTTWLFATDNSDAAQQAFIMLVHQIRRPGDKVHVIFSTSGSSTQCVLESYQAILHKLKIEGQCMVRSNTAQETVVGSILEAARIVEADSLVLGISGYSKAKLGSVSEECSQKSRCSILVLKDAHEVKEHRALAGVWQEQLQADRKKEKSRASRSSTDFTPHVAGIQDSVELLQPRIGRMSLTGSGSLTSHAAEAHDHAHAEPHMQRVAEEEADGAEGEGAVQQPAAAPGQQLGRRSKSVQGAGLARPAISVQASSAHAAPGAGLFKQQK